MHAWEKLKQPSVSPVSGQTQLRGIEAARAWGDNTGGQLDWSVCLKGMLSIPVK